MNSTNKIQLELIVDTCSNGTQINNRQIRSMLTILASCALSNYIPNLSTIDKNEKIEQQRINIQNQITEILSKIHKQKQSEQQNLEKYCINTINQFTEVVLNKFQIIDKIQKSIQKSIIQQNNNVTKIQEYRKQDKLLMNNINNYVIKINNVLDQSSKLLNKQFKELQNKIQVVITKFEALQKNIPSTFNSLQQQISSSLNQSNQPNQLYQQSINMEAPIHTFTLSYLTLSQKDLQSYEKKQKTRQNLKLNQIGSLTPDHKIVDFISQMKSKQLINKNQQIRIWKHNKDISLDKFYNHIVVSCKPLGYQNMKIKSLGKKIQNIEQKIGDLNIQQGDYFVLQVIENNKIAIIFQVQRKCQKCQTFKKLTHFCNCKQVGYCSQKCLLGDRNYHEQRCKLQ